MTRPAAHIPDPDAALDGDEGLRRVQAFRRLAERGLIHGDTDERALVLDIIAFLDTGAEGGFEAAVGLGGPGHTGALRRYRQERRDEAVRRLWPVCGRGLSAKAAAGLIAQDWKRYKSGAWRRHEAAGIMPSDEPWATFAWLLGAGHQPLASETIRRILCSDVGHLQAVEPPSQSDDL